MEPFYIQLILTAFHLLIGFLVVFIIFRLLKRFFKLFLKTIGDTQSSGLNLFISFGIALLFLAVIQM